MAATPQPPQQPQPIYPNEFNLAVDRLYARLASYVDSRLDPIVVQMRVDRQDAQARDDALLRRLDALTATVQGQSAVQQNLVTITQGLVTAVQELQAGQRALQQQISDGFAMLSERLNELVVRVERLEGGGQNPPPQA
jgi:uncharacterized protein YoxC